MASDFIQKVNPTQFLYKKYISKSLKWIEKKKEKTHPGNR